LLGDAAEGAVSLQGAALADLRGLAPGLFEASTEDRGSAQVKLDQSETRLEVVGVEPRGGLELFPDPSRERRLFQHARSDRLVSVGSGEPKVVLGVLRLERDGFLQPLHGAGGISGGEQSPSEIVGRPGILRALFGRRRRRDGSGPALASGFAGHQRGDSP
jgi:hypothetical protein